MGENTTNNTPEIDATRGIQNAEARYKKHSENRLTSTQLQSSERRERHRSRSQPQNRNRTIQFNGTNQRDVQRMYSAIREIFSEGGESFDESDVREISELKTRSVEKPGFPFFIFTVAVLKDLLDVIATLIVVGVPITMALSFLMSIILFFWSFGKMSGGWWKKRMIRYILVRYGIMFAIEAVPLVNIVPTTTIFILLVHHRETKIVKLINLGLEKLHHSGIR